MVTKNVAISRVGRRFAASEARHHRYPPFMSTLSIGFIRLGSVLAELIGRFTPTTPPRDRGLGTTRRVRAHKQETPTGFGGKLWVGACYKQGTPPGFAYDLRGR